MLDLGFRRGRVLLQQTHGRHNHSRRAISALEGVGVQESLLDRVKIAVLLKTLNGHNRPRPD
jgi:hypothetical protein